MEEDPFVCKCIQPKVSTRVNGATELYSEGSQSEAAVANFWLFSDADWLPQHGCIHPCALDSQVYGPFDRPESNRDFCLNEVFGSMDEVLR